MRHGGRYEVARARRQEAYLETARRMAALLQCAWYCAHRAVASAAPGEGKNRLLRP